MSQAFAMAQGACWMLYPEQRTEIQAWNDYFRDKGMGGRVKEMRKWLRGDVPSMHGRAERYSVPSQWPWQFDQSYSSTAGDPLD